MSSKRLAAPDKRSVQSRLAHRRRSSPTHDDVLAQVTPGLGPVIVTEEERARMIAAVAYFRARQRGFSCCHELDDWWAAEREIDTACGRARFSRRVP